MPTITHTLTQVSETFLPGTVVGAYVAPERDLRGSPPPGQPVDVSTVAADGSLQFGGLQPQARYIAWANGRSIGFQTGTFQGSIEDLYDLLGIDSDGIATALRGAHFTLSDDPDDIGLLIQDNPDAPRTLGTQLLLLKDLNGAPIFAVGPAGGPKVFGDHLGVWYDVFARAVDLAPWGTIQLGLESGPRIWAGSGPPLPSNITSLLDYYSSVDDFTEPYAHAGDLYIQKDAGGLIWRCTTSGSDTDGSRVGTWAKYGSGDSFNGIKGLAYAPAGRLATNIPSEAVEKAIPFFVPFTQPFTKIGCEVTLAGDGAAAVRLGIRRDDGSGAFPDAGAPLLDAGTVDATSTGDKPITISQTLSRGWYWLTATVQGAATTRPTLRAYESSFQNVGTVDPKGTALGYPLNCYSKSGVTGALGAWGTTAANDILATRVYLKT